MSCIKVNCCVFPDFSPRPTPSNCFKQWQKYHRSGSCDSAVLVSICLVLRVLNYIKWLFFIFIFIVMAKCYGPACCSYMPCTLSKLNYKNRSGHIFRILCILSLLNIKMFPDKYKKVQNILKSCLIIIFYEYINRANRNWNQYVSFRYF